MDVKKLLLLLGMVSCWTAVFAQMSDEQVVNMLQEARSQGKSQQEMLLMLSQKGVTKDQLLRIKENYGASMQDTDGTAVQESRMRANQTAVAPATWVDSLGMAVAAADAVKTAKGKGVFGREVFNNAMLTFEPNLNIATPETYILGPGDEVIIDIWGDSKQTLRQQISPDGTITDPQVGPIVLNGLSVKEANGRLKNAYTGIYSTMGGAQPTTFMKMSLGEIRSIRVNVMGEVMMPGTYTLPSLASLFHALYSAGGVNDIGSLREVRVSRGGKEIMQADIYDYLLKGKSSLDIRLEDGDVVIVSPYRNLVTLKGKVKRPLIYEMKDGETVETLLGFAGGFTGDAYKESLRVIRKSGREYQVFNIDGDEFASFALVDGDEVSVDPMLDRFENRVEIRGAVYRAGLYALGDDVTTVKQLIAKAEGVRGDAFLNRAVLNRELPNRMREVVSVDVKGLLDGVVEDLPLRRNDELYIPSIFDLQEEYTVNVSGAVGVPGVYPFAEGMSVEDMIVRAGGLKEAASVVKVDVARRIKDPKSMETTGVLAENFTLTLKDGLVVEGAKDFVLKPFDEIFVRRSPGYHEQQTVTVTGEVQFAGQYVLSKKNERLSDLVKKAGGITPDAYLKGARLLRRLNDAERARVQSLLKLSQQSQRDSIALNSLDLGDTYFVGVDVVQALKNPGSDHDIVLREGDVLQIPQYTGTVRISGAVMYPNTVVYKPGAGLKHYIEQGGGFAARAKKKRAFVVHMNGTVSRVRSLGRTKVAPGSEIIVPVRPPRKGMGLAEIMSIASSTTSMAALVTSIINNTK